MGCIDSMDLMESINCTFSHIHSISIDISIDILIDIFH